MKKGYGWKGEGNEGGRENLKGEDGMEFRVCVRHTPLAIATDNHRK